MAAFSQAGTSLLGKIRGRIARWLAPEIFALMDQASAAPLETPAEPPPLVPQPDSPPEHWLSMVRSRAPQLLQPEHEGGSPHMTVASPPPPTAPARLRPATPSRAVASRRSPVPLALLPGQPRSSSSVPPARSSAAVVPSLLPSSRSRNDARLAPPAASTPASNAPPPSNAPSAVAQRTEPPPAVSIGPERERKAPREEITPEQQSEPILSAAQTIEPQAPPVFVLSREMPLWEAPAATTIEEPVEETRNTGTNATVNVSNPTAWEKPVVVTAAFEDPRNVPALPIQAERVLTARRPSHRRPRLNPPPGPYPPRPGPPQPSLKAAPKGRWPRLLESTFQEEDWRTRQNRENRDMLLRREQDGGD